MLPQQISELHGRIVGATPHEIAAASQMVITAINHSIFQKSEAGRHQTATLRREVPVVTRSADGSLVEGIVDLAFRDSTVDGQSWIVVDFKTDRNPTQAAAAYERQVSLYCHAITASTGLPCSGYIVAL